MSLIGGVPIVSTCFGAIGPVILFVLIQPVWIYMD
jgi:hypothetical protein